MVNPESYWVRRVTKEQRLAQKSGTEGAAHVHRDLSRRFLQIAFSDPGPGLSK
jgi:hypothetical protein